jgi:hypothetical protein
MKRALLFSGGENIRGNKPRYRNDLAAFYKTLTQVYQYPKKEIKLCFAAGGEYDFDDDGQDEPYTRASQGHLLEHLAWLATATKEDTILFVASNHGSPEGLSLWSEDAFVTPQQMATALSSCEAKKIFIFGQCYAGIFGHGLQQLSQAVVCCACSEIEESLPVPYHKKEIPPYDEFLYHMAGALGGQYPDGVPLTAPLSSKAHTIYEAFDYARRKDRNMQTPLFFPESESWAQQIQL